MDFSNRALGKDTEMSADKTDPTRVRIMAKIHALAEMLCTNAIDAGASPLETIGAMMIAVGGLYEAEAQEREYIRSLLQAIDARLLLIDGQAAPVTAAPDIGEILVSAKGSSEARVLAAAHELSRACARARFTNQEIVDTVGVLLLGMLDSPSKPRALIKSLVHGLRDVLEAN